MKRIIRRSAAAHDKLLTSHPVLERILRSRGVLSMESLDYSLIRLLPFSSLMHIDVAARFLADIVERQQKILIVGDFDADGATSTALSIRALKALGANNIDYLVSNRFNYGYGLTPELVDVAKTFQPDVIMTVDNGISSLSGVAAAKKAGIRVIITDHHLAPPQLPEADVIVNPNQEGDAFPSKALAGVGVVFYILLALRAELRQRHWFQRQSIAEPNLAHFLDIVALGTVADVVPLDDNNRILVAHGLKRIRAGKCVAGIRALLSVAKRVEQNATTQDLGFAVGPRLNAAGRMDDMSIGIECLLTDNFDAALVLAEQLDAFNQERKAVERDMQSQAVQSLKSLSLTPDQSLPLGLCFFDESWHQGVIGILASRLKDRTHRPVIAFASESGSVVKGSARSISGVHIRDMLVEVDAHYPGLILKFGGHAMAAGLSLLKSNITLFEQAWNVILARHIDPCLLEKVIHTDGELACEDLTLRFAEMLEDSGPWGQQFPEPLFDGRFLIVDEKILAGKYVKFSLMPEYSDKILDGVAFSVDLDTWPFQKCALAHLVYRLDINQFRERRKLQLIIEQIEPVRF
ncbi:MAG: single-stranded-DNA-specific exonuclease RecJ [Gammaproteobacteria bacterium]|nr:single-stranded-DNA-specific exonuclease RecJ [Gammaproteobacteria bacterium]MCD8542787.1 single-stranded-DNA-specific exonuclease RecJ [Gammaproteobacteria bacterium]